MIEAEPSPSPRWQVIGGGSLPALALLYVFLYGAFGTESPFFPSFLATRGISNQGLAIVLSVGTIVRMVSGPLVGVSADLFGTQRILALTACGAATIILLYLAVGGFWPLLFVSMLHSVAIAPLAPLADALALEASARERSFPYGWVRGIGSAGFIVGTMVSGIIVTRYGISSIILAAALLFFLMTMPIWLLQPAQRSGVRMAWDRVVDLLAHPIFRRMLLVSSLVIGSHAMSDTFAVILWRHAAIGSTTIGLLWSEAVASEIIVFFVLGPWLICRLGPGPSAAIAATAGVVRWIAVSQSVTIAVLGATQLLHGLTFSLMHLACMQVIANVVPGEISATAQTLYGTLCLGLASATLTFLSGELYGSFGAHAFLTMSGLCVLAIPLAFGLGRPRRIN